ncbi:hypothetical protein N9T15_00610 [Pelagibacteraceae bacterium]|nr:hypothetical protein [Pelagibacteraceae bacterium]
MKKLILIIAVLFVSCSNVSAKEEIWDCPFTDGSGRQIYKIAYEKKTIFIRSSNPLKWEDMADGLGTATTRVIFNTKNDVVTVEWSHGDDIWMKYRTFDLVLRKVIWARTQTCTVIN